jgi:translation initiation factor 1
MGEICSICGLPQDICVCSQMDSQERKISIFEKRAKGRKFVTLVSGIDEKKDAEELLKSMKKELACGGTLKGERIELQGKQKRAITNFLKKKGYNDSQIV